MLYHASNPPLNIIGVEHLSWKGGRFHVAPREYASLAFRIKGDATIRSQSGTHRVNANDVLYVPQNMEYTAQYTDTEILVFHFVTLSNDESIEVYTFQNSEQLYKLFLQAYALWQNKESGFSIYAMAILYAILGQILEKETREKLPPHFLKAVSLINTDYRNNSLSIHDVCAEAGISATVFRQLFKQHYQKTPLEYITGLRLEYARNRIAGGASVEAAAYESGFNDAKYFARVVKKHFGCTPRAFRSYGK